MNSEDFFLCMDQFSQYMENHLDETYKDYLKGDEILTVSGFLFLISKDFESKIDSLNSLYQDLDMIYCNGEDFLLNFHYGKARVTDVFEHFKTMYFNNDEFDLSNEFTPTLKSGIVGVYQDLYDKIGQKNEFKDGYGTAVSRFMNLPIVMKNIKDVFYTSEDYKEMLKLITDFLNEK